MIAANSPSSRLETPSLDLPINHHPSLDTPPVTPPSISSETSIHPVTNTTTLPVPAADPASVYIRRAGMYWNDFYRHNTSNFFKDRHWTDREFEELKPVESFAYSMFSGYFDL